MRWCSYKDPSYLTDEESRFLRDPRFRRFVTVLEWARSIAGVALTLLAVFALLLVGVVFRVSNWVWIASSVVAIFILSWVVSRISFLKRAPVRCSRCARLMDREHEIAGNRRDYFFVCRRCKRYVFVDSLFGD